MNNYEYKTLTETEKHDMVVNTYRANEMDHFSHNLNKERYENMLPSLDEGAFKERIMHLLAETNGRIVEVSSILASTEAQLPTEAEIAASLLRTKQKEDALSGAIVK